MALNKNTVSKAIALLRKLNPEIQGEMHYYQNAPEKKELPTDMIICVGAKSDGGYESISTIIREPIKEQIQLFHTMKTRIGSTAIEEWMPEDKFRIGFF